MGPQQKQCSCDMDKPADCGDAAAYAGAARTARGDVREEKHRFLQADTSRYLVLKGRQ